MLIFSVIKSMHVKKIIVRVSDTWKVKAKILQMK